MQKPQRKNSGKVTQGDVAKAFRETDPINALRKELEETKALLDRKQEELSIALDIMLDNQVDEFLDECSKLDKK